ncbi:GGDEF domain-containing protein [Silvibacterium acidisoli]|uniref:GGDEF domain-containing protein n=1 Tax=Acidobacteriaceae bacterium ZG23-2 TaxID=2883246 RepID=UPI00406CCF6B
MKRRLRLGVLLGSALGLLALQALLIWRYREFSGDLNDYFTFGATALGFSACLWRTFRAPEKTRLPWALFTCGIFLWLIGISGSVWFTVVKNVSDVAVYFFHLAYFLYGVPLMLAISLPMGEDRQPLFLWLDGLQSLITACVAYVALFSAFPIGGQQVQPISAEIMAATYNVENLVLAIGSTLRLIAHPEHGPVRRLYRTFSLFLWVYAVCAGVYNHMTLRLNGIIYFYGLLALAPFLCLAVDVFSLRGPEPAGETSAGGSSLLAEWLDNASPVLYTTALLLLGLSIARKHFYWGSASILVALAVYMLRSTLLQTQVMRAQRALSRANRQLEALSLTDGLTGVANRRCFDRMLQLEWSRAFRLAQPLSLLLIDIDFFKSLNDRYGHLQGDSCLVSVAQALSQSLGRSGDMLARYGGEEFAAILADTDHQGAEAVAMRMREAVHALKIVNETTLGDYVTVSMGMTTGVPGESTSASLLVDTADHALYTAKRNGRDCYAFLPLMSEANNPSS